MVLGAGHDTRSMARVLWGPRDYLAFGASTMGRPEAPGMRRAWAPSSRSHTCPSSGPAKARKTLDTHLSGDYEVVHLPQGRPKEPGGAEGRPAPQASGCLAFCWLRPHGRGAGAYAPRCITRRECMCSTALHSCTKYFHTVLSGMSRFCFLKY